MVYKMQRAHSGGVLHGARPRWLMNPFFAIIVSAPRSYLKIPCTRKVTCSKSQTQDPQILGTTRKFRSPGDLVPGICAPLHYVYDGLILRVPRHASTPT
jgi:hypothetical protein